MYDKMTFFYLWELKIFIFHFSPIDVNHVGCALFIILNEMLLVFCRQLLRYFYSLSFHVINNNAFTYETLIKVKIKIDFSRTKNKKKNLKIVTFYDLRKNC